MEGYRLHCCTERRDGCGLRPSMGRAGFRFFISVISSSSSFFFLGGGRFTKFMTWGLRTN